MRFNVKRKGWFNDSKKDCIIRISKGDRDMLGITSNDLVIVKKGDKSEMAIVRPQFTDLLSFPEMVSVNSILAVKLGLEVGDDIEVLANVTTEQKEKYVSPEEFEIRQVIGQMALCNQKKKASDILRSLGLFADEEIAQEGVVANERGERARGQTRPNGRVVPEEENDTENSE